VTFRRLDTMRRQVQHETLVLDPEHRSPLLDRDRLDVIPAQTPSWASYDDSVAVDYQDRLGADRRAGVVDRRHREEREQQYSGYGVVFSRHGVHRKHHEERRRPGADPSAAANNQRR
jgi:hypothetical protein